MEGREGISSGGENPSQGGGGGLAVSLALAGKKRRGRPRKYGADGTMSLALSPMPISSSGPATGPTVALGTVPEMGDGEFPAVVKRGRGRPVGSVNRPKPPRMDLDPSGEWTAPSAGANFTPHVITVATGEDVTMKIISFSQQVPGAICILSANGVISNVTLRQPDSSGGTLTYEGRFEILSLSGSFMAMENGGTRSRTGGMSVSLASPDGRVVGGGVAGLLVAASPVQVVVGHFLPNNQQEQKPKKPKIESTSATPTSPFTISSANMDNAYGGQVQHSSKTQKPSLASSSSFRGDNWSSLHSLPTDINISLPGG
ncbi:AT-hook motif nuclear-localized protein 1 [Magnolia sinica]|uniref:AT-hook motif nuclear-localized protein 1 n=1 Tax=Magnolia sinica TaxID=86752 RepID=UPI002659AC26|nr:AT-hook motif nuclear-localized protein 1 [Magnolia sinica]